MEKEGRYQSAFAYFNQAYRNYNGIDDVFVKLVMFWQLDLAFGEEFYPMLHRVYREVPEAEQPKTDSEKIQQFIISASEVADCNLTPFFEMWGLSPTRETKKRISQLPDLTEPIWRLTDAGYVLPPVYLRAEDALGPLGSLAGATLTGATPVRVEAPDMLVTGVEVTVDGKIVYQGESVPTDLVLRPSEFKTAGGVTSEVTERVVIKNWGILEDEILPPKALGWFGVRDSLKTAGEPKGWVYATADAELFFGDEDRIMRGQGSVEPLTWRVPNLYQYVLTIYAKETEINDDVIVQVSSDGDFWIEVPYEIHAVYPEGSLDSPWVQMKLSGLVPKDICAQLFRVMFSGRSLPPEDLQLGHVYLAGVGNPASLQLLPY